MSGGKWVYPHGDAATRVRDAVNAELKSRGMQPDAKIFCELLAVADESWQDCVEACLGDRRFDILVPPAHYEAAKSAFVALKDKVGPISLLDTPGIRKANRHAETAPADSLAAQVTSENPLAAQYADTILRRIVCHSRGVDCHLLCIETDWLQYQLADPFGHGACHCDCGR